MPASSSDRRDALAVYMPTTWSELTETQFLYVIGLLAMGVPAERAQVYAFLRFAGLGIVKADADTLLLRRGGDLCRIARRDLLLGAMSLDFMQEPPDVPQRPAEWQGRKAVDAQMHGVPFGHYLQIENYMQRYIAQPDDALLLPMAALLYPGLSPKNVPPLLRYAMLHWLTGLKLFFARAFPDLYRPVKADADEPADLRGAMLAQVRALTAGDVTKEQTVLNVDTWTALDELNAKAREARELEKIYKKH